MVNGCGNNIVKLILFVSNFLICVLGGALLAIGFWSLLDKNFAGHLQDLVDKTEISENLVNVERNQKCMWALVLVGGSLCIFGFVGCCGATCENVRLLSLYFIIVFILVIAEVVVVVVALTNKTVFKKEVKNVVLKAYTERPDQFKPFQEAFKCCGINGTKEPGSKAPECPRAVEIGCVDAVWAAIDKAELLLILICVIILVVEFVALAFTCVLCMALRQRNGYLNYD